MTWWYMSIWGFSKFWDISLKTVKVHHSTVTYFLPLCLWFYSCNLPILPPQPTTKIMFIKCISSLNSFPWLFSTNIISPCFDLLRILFAPFLGTNLYLFNFIRPYIIMMWVLHCISASEIISSSGYIWVLFIWEASPAQQPPHFHQAQGIALHMTGPVDFFLKIFH